MTALLIGDSVERTVIDAVQWLRLGIDAAGALALGGSVSTALAQLAAASTRGRPLDFTAVRLRLARYLALELQLGADMRSTAFAPTWDQIGKLGAIAEIRRGLNFFLMREPREASATPAAETLR